MIGNSEARHRWLSLLPAALLAAFLTPSADAGRIEFLVAELPGTVDPHGDSYVVTIDESQTELIDHARALVDWVEAGGAPQTSPGATILVSDIAAGSDGINRDVLAPGEPLWSWHLVGEPSFADFTIEVLDGWPTFVGRDVPGWIANTNGRIGFWGYTVVAELGPVIPEPSAITLFAAGAMAMLTATHIARGSHTNGGVEPARPFRRRRLSIQ